jgi:hypothetical protein
MIDEPTQKSWPQNKEATKINFMNFESETMPWLFISFVIDLQPYKFVFYFSVASLFCGHQKIFKRLNPDLRYLNQHPDYFFHFFSFVALF